MPAAAAVLCLGAGCSPLPYPALPLDRNALPPPNVAVADLELRDVVLVGKPLIERVPGTDQLRVVVAIRNVDDELIEVLAEGHFLDAARQVGDGDTSRQAYVLPPGATVTWLAVSRCAAACEWELLLSWDR